MARGKAYTDGQKEFIVILKQSYDKEKIEHETISTKDPADRVSKGLNVSLRTVRSVLSEHNKERYNDSPTGITSYKNRGKPEFRISSALETIIRQRIRTLNRFGQYVSCRSLCGWLTQEYKIEIHNKTLWRTLKRMGFIHGQSKRRSVLKERDYVIIARREYLRQKINNRKKNNEGDVIRPEVYLDESYINVNHSVDKTWYHGGDGPWVNKPSGKGPRLIIVNAITKDGWVPNAKLVFQAKQSTGDYHGQPKSLIFMDNAKYHNTYVEDAFPTPKTPKHELEKWLKANHPSVYKEKEKPLKPELYKKCKELSPKPKYMLDRIAEKYGHTILRTPQYHPELQPIEICWGIIKNYCARKCDYTMVNLKKYLEISFNEVTPTNIEEILIEMRCEEDRYWTEDHVDDENDEFSEEEIFYDYLYYSYL
jgi:transposase